MTKEAYYKIGILIMALCAITWMFMSNSWGADSNPKSNPSVYITKMEVPYGKQNQQPV